MKSFMFFLAVLLCPMLLVQGQSSREYPDRPVISVTGEALVNVVPDRIVITGGIETWNEDVERAKESNREGLRRCISMLREAGVPEKDIQTDNLSIEPRWKEEYRKEGFLGFFVRNSFTVTLGDPARVEDIVTRLLDKGVNYIHGIDFQTSELKKHKERAREMALKAAQEKAEKMAAALGAGIGRPLRVQENSYGSPWYAGSWGYWGYSSRGRGMSQNVMEDAGGSASAAEGSVALGQIGIRANVSVDFELK